ncbi:MAG: DNA methylase [Syntrophaceae bacterium]|nr:DNA methylase [Syntrophaceae bacterium]
MTGVAAQMCGDRVTVESLGYQVKPDGTILRQETNENGKSVWVVFSKLGPRRAVLNDLPPAATFIAYNYNTPIDVPAFEQEAKRILKEVEEECGWMYETKHEDGRIGKINYTVWSDVFICPECAGEVVFWEAAVDKEAGKVQDEFPCPYCQVELTKRKMDRAWSTKYDTALKGMIKQARQVPVLINYTMPGVKGRFEKRPDEIDLALIDKIENSEIPYWFPKNDILKGDKTGESLRLGITHVHHYYTKRNLWVLAAILDKCSLKMKLLFQSVAATLCSKLVRYNMGHRGNGPLNGTLYISSMIAESNVIKVIKGKQKDFIRAFVAQQRSWLTIQSLEHIQAPSSTADYVFIDPPFGSNIMYSELNYLWESWLKIHTNNKPEAIENRTQQKGLNEYRQLMTVCFNEIYRILKPGRWMTVEFSNTKASVWNSIQAALTKAGFIIANVSALDKKQGSFNAVTNTTSVKQDLIISAYKPNGGFEVRFLNEATTEEGVWDFVRTHLKYLPVTKKQGRELVPVPERDPRILFDQMVAYYVRKGYPVSISSQEFQLGLIQRFPERDGMYFLPDHAAAYDRKKMLAGSVKKQIEMFVKDESSAIDWLRQILRDNPLSFQDLNPQFMKKISSWSKNEKGIELSTLLEQNFLCYDGKGPVPEQIHAYLSSNWKDMRNLPKDDPVLRTKGKDRWYVPDPNKAGDLEKLRERTLLREFEEYRESKQKRLKVFRLEAVRAGFKKAWQERNYQIIIDIAKKIPDNILQEDPKLLMWYDQAVTRKGEDT